MGCFQYMKDIYYKSFEQFTKDVDIARNDMLRADPDKIRQKPIRIELNTAEELPEGRLDIQYEDIDFECFFHHKPEKILYVFLNGATAGERSTAPILQRWTYYKFINGSMLNISDPMHRMNDNLELGWYYGDEETDLQQKVADMVMKVAGIIGVEQHNIIFMGSSGGGYASIACASRIHGAKSIAVNPQIVLCEWGYSAKFTQIMGIDLTWDDKWHRNNLIYYLQNREDNRYLLFVNMRSRADMRQVNNICQAMNKKVKYGLNIFGNVIIWIYDADLMPWMDYHNVQETYWQWFLFELIMNSPVEELNKYDSFFRLINEFYFDMRKNERYWRGKIPDLDRLMQLRTMQREIAIFGMGEYVELLNRELFCIEKQNYYQIRYVIDNDIEKKGLYLGLPVKHPSEIDNWSDLYIIITSLRFHTQIRQQLEAAGLIYEKDFILYKDLYSAAKKS